MEKGRAVERVGWTEEEGGEPELSLRVGRAEGRV